MDQPVTYDEHVRAFGDSVSAFAEAVRAGAADRTVPSCPDYSLRDLTKHVGDVVVFWSHLLCDALDREPTPFPPLPDKGIDRWFEDLAADTVDLLGRASPDTDLWTWHPAHQHAGFAARRLAHELTVHRYDAQLVSQTAQPIDPPVAADGIDEIFTMMEVSQRTGAAAGQTLHLHATDGDLEWMITLHPDRVEVAREHGKADAALRGSVGDLELTLYGRPTLGAVETLGDPAVVEAWYREFTFG